MSETENGHSPPTHTDLLTSTPPVEQMRDPLQSAWNLSLVQPDNAEPAHRDAIVPAEGDLSGTIDFSLMNAIFENFLEVIGLPIAIIDLKGCVLASSKWQRLCMEFHRVKDGTLARCIESDVSLSRDMEGEKQYAIYRCRNGLTDCATPIIVEGVHVANLFIGQFLLAAPDRGYFKRQQEQFGFDETAYFDALSEVPIVSEQRLPAILRLMGGLAQQIARQSLTEKRVLASYAVVEKQVAERTRELKQSHERWRQIAAQVPGLVYQFRLRSDGTMSMPYASDAIRDIFMVGPDEVREDASPIFAAVIADDRENLIASIHDSAQTLSPWHHEFRVRQGESGVRWLYGNAIPQRDSDTTILWHGFVTDISDRKRDEEALRQKSAELARSNADLERFAYVASHDLQTPLRTITSFTQLLDLRYRHRLDSDADEFISFIVDGAKHMSRLITDLLDYARVTSQGQPMTPIPARHAVDEALANLKAATDESAAVITVGPLPVIMADGSQLVSLFQNLIGNALKYRDPSRTPRILITANRNSTSEWRFSVQDNGIGIEAQYFEKIFEIFQRLQPANEFEGTGIGLAVCQRIVHRLGGNIWVESAPGLGSTFIFTIPETIAPHA